MSSAQENMYLTIYNFGPLVLAFLKQQLQMLERGTRGDDTIGRVAAKISNARHEYPIGAAEYGAALALTLECEFSTNASS